MLGRRGLLALPALLLAGCARAEPFALPTPESGLRPLGGLVLDTGAWGFGGFSGLVLTPGPRLHAVSDLGHWWSALLLRDAQGAPIGLAEVRHGRLRDAAGAPLRGRANSDAECLTRLQDGRWLIGFERRHRIQQHARLHGPGRPFPAPPGLERAPSNGGLEALTQLADGRLLGIAEELPGTAPRTRAAWLGTLRGRGAVWQQRDYQPTTGYDPTGAGALPGGGALVLERQFSLLGGFRARLLRLDPAAPGVLRGTALLEMPGDAPAENYEGVAALREGGRTLVGIISDDNERAAQRTLLLLYAMG